MKNLKVGLQLYSIREDMEKDMDAALKAVHDMGYEYVEFAGYFGKSAAEVLTLLEKHNLKCISVHQGYNVFLEDPKTNVEFLRTIGAKYCAIPWMGIENHKGHEGFDKAVKDIACVGALLRDNGIQLMYHNHDFEFGKYEDKFLLDWLYETIPSDLLMPQIDTCWVHYAGYDPCKYLEKYSGKIKIVHLKDFVCKNLAQGPVYALIDDSGNEGQKASQEDNGFEFRPVGQGIQDFPAILEASAKAGAEYVIVEQDQSPTASPLESARQSREYLKSLGI